MSVCLFASAVSVCPSFLPSFSSQQQPVKPSTGMEVWCVVYGVWCVVCGVWCVVCVYVYVYVYVWLMVCGWNTDVFSLSLSPVIQALLW